MSGNARWRVYAIAGEHTIWHDGKIFQASDGEILSGLDGGYATLEELLRAQRIASPVVPVPESERDVHADGGPRHRRPKGWGAYFRLESGWVRVFPESKGRWNAPRHFRTAKAARAAAKRGKAEMERSMAEAEAAYLAETNAVR